MKCPFDNFNNLISFIFILIIVLTCLLLFSCSSKNTYYIYLKHQPNDVLYETNSLKDAEDYYDQFKPFHSDMYITKN